MLLTTEVTQAQGCAIVSIGGELDLNTAETLRDTLASASMDRALSVVLDLAGLSFCDSAGLAVFVKAHNELGERGRKLVLARPGPSVLRILSLSGLDQIIAIATGDDDACAMAR